MVRTAKSKLIQPLTTAQRLSSIVKACRDIMRKDKGLNGDLDVLLIVKDEAAGLKRDLRWIGYLLAATTDVLPSIFAYTEEEWESRRRSGSTFRKAVERDGVCFA